MFHGKLFGGVLAAALGAFAFHDFPADYDSAPLVATTTLELEAGKPFSISHNSMHWRADLWESVKSGETKQFFDGNAWDRKFGMATVSSAIELGGQKLAPGSYEVFSFVPGSDTSKFFLSFRKDGAKVDVPVDMKEGDVEEDHLLLALTPRGGKGSTAFELKVFYGKMRGSASGMIPKKS